MNASKDMQRIAHNEVTKALLYGELQRKSCEKGKRGKSCAMLKTDETHPLAPLLRMPRFYAS